MSEILLHIEKHNQVVRESAHLISSKALANIEAMGIVHDGTLFRKLRYRLKHRDLEIEGIGFRFPRHGIYIHHGAGRGQGGRKGSSWYGPDGQLKSTKATSKGKMGLGNRKERPWLNDALDEEVPTLADKLAVLGADVSVRNVVINTGGADGK